ncbi:MAG: DUF1353 domain-containing protein [Methylococcales bacterium]|nr:DUF1353 domain-containing protein [Methylococcales bacterium]
MPHVYSGSIQVKFTNLPSLRPILLKTQFNSFINRLKGASKRRYFYLERNWNVTVDGIDYNQNLNGTIIVPKTHNNVETRIDGASVPLPWVVSFLSFGILRPLGILLTASIVHDFAFEHGALIHRDASGTEKLQPVERDVADRLFRDMISTVNRMPVVAFIAWVVVRLGWFFVKYNGQPRGGAFPYIPLLISLAILLLFAGLIQLFGLVTFISAVLLFYLIMYGIVSFYH